MVIICIVLISVSGKTKDKDETVTKDKTFEKVLTIIFASCTGLVLGYNSIDLFASLSLGVDGL